VVKVNFAKRHAVASRRFRPAVRDLKIRRYENKKRPEGEPPAVRAVSDVGRCMNPVGRYV
jgi:hypothetical protein